MRLSPEATELLTRILGHSMIDLEEYDPANVRAIGHQHLPADRSRYLGEIRDLRSALYLAESQGKGAFVSIEIQEETGGAG